MAESTPEMYENYFSNRGVTAETYQSYTLPTYLRNALPLDKASKILDIGCGYGQTLNALKQNGYSNLKGIELIQDAATYCQTVLGLDVGCTGDIIGYSNLNPTSFDCIIMSHVLEHLPKTETIATLQAIKKMLKPGGYLLLMVPNGQSPTHSYWMWEDFTHYTLFTTGSIGHVLKVAGFKQCEFLDPYDLEDKPLITRLIKRFFQYIYRINKAFWNSVNSSGYHYSSKVIYTWELKVKATI